MLVETDGENVLSSRGALATPFANSLQTAVRDQVHSKTRVRYPMVRKGFLASPDKPQGVRGQDEFVRVSWGAGAGSDRCPASADPRQLRSGLHFLPAPTAGALTAYCIRRRRCCSAI
ncbi:hypothetical protein LNP74_11455 [Klebsiella pneumoniae subsp. pneumoniae]|nr:hypothetical protein [Klebsiella pneumoniae subsp. pneumoniae]